MKVKFHDIVFHYDTEKDRCATSTAQGTTEHENPYIGLNVFISHITSLLHSQLAEEIVKNGRDKWIGEKNEH